LVVTTTHIKDSYLRRGGPNQRHVHDDGIHFASGQYPHRRCDGG
jgi:hypothetical protein